MTSSRVLVVSSVLPVPGRSGQQIRVANTLRGLGRRFDVTFLAPVEPAALAETRARLAGLCDQVLLIPARYTGAPWNRVALRACAALYALATGLKPSNFLVGSVELTPHRVLRATEGHDFDLAVFEYWHAHRAAGALRARGVPVVLDMHNLLWRSYERDLCARRFLPARYRKLRVAQYRRHEEAAWEAFDALITINRDEDAYVARRFPEKHRLYAPMGVDLKQWRYSPTPATPPRLGYYGGLASAHNRQAALQCLLRVMPRVWASAPATSFWIVGSDPPAEILAMAQREPRVMVPGFLRDVSGTLSTLSALVCPWTGTYGFRSRFVETMALGVPVITTEAAVAGMDLENGQGCFLTSSFEEMAEIALRLLGSPPLQKQQSLLARAAIERHYGFEATYLGLADGLSSLVQKRAA